MKARASRLLPGPDRGNQQAAGGFLFRVLVMLEHEVQSLFGGAGGLGQPILRGIRLNDLSLILAGAIPAALLALLLQLLIDTIEWAVTPRGLKRGAEIRD